MQNISLWKPSKYEYYRGKLRGSRNQNELSLSSRIQGDVVGNFYQRYLKDFARGHLIDLGCGKVPLYMEYKKYVTEITCADWSESFHKNPYTDIDCNLNDRLPFGDSSCDTIILSDVLEHIAEPRDLCCEMSRILRPGGIILMNVPFYYRLHEIPFDYFRYTKYAMTHLCRLAGLNVKLIEPLGGVPEVLADILMKTFAYKPIVGKPIARTIHECYRLFMRLPAGRKFSRKSSETFPLGYFVVAEKAGSDKTKQQVQ
jgi:SAM-dependent methyltransferase